MSQRNSHHEDSIYNTLKQDVYGDSSIYKRVSLKQAKNVRIKRSLCFYNPYEVYVALTGNKEVLKWLEFISNHYVPPKARILLMYPCSAKKPYYESRSYKRLFETLSKLGKKRKEVHVVTISEPFGLIPEEFYGRKVAWHDWGDSWYDCPGLFEWWCRRYGQPYSKEYLDKCVRILAGYVAKFFEKAKIMKSYLRMIAFVRTFSSNLKVRADHTHRRIVELAAKTADVTVDILPPKEVVSKIVSKRGKLAWDLYGVSHPIAQDYLLDYLKEMLRHEN
jgi:archaeosine synthase